MPSATLATPKAPAIPQNNNVTQQQRVLLLGDGGADAAGIAEYLQALGLSAVAVQDRPGSPALDQIEQLGNVCFAVAMPDGAIASHLADGNADSGERVLAAFELGYLVGKLGSKRVAILDRQPPPPDARVQGICRVLLDGNSGWQLQLARQLRRAGVEIDLNRLC